MEQPENALLRSYGTYPPQRLNSKETLLHMYKATNAGGSNAKGHFKTVFISTEFYTVYYMLVSMREAQTTNMVDLLLTNTGAIPFSVHFYINSATNSFKESKMMFCLIRNRKKGKLLIVFVCHSMDDN